MTKRWAEAELRFLRDNAEKMSVQALADALSVRIDELEKKMEKLGLTGGSVDAPAPKKAQTLKELSRHTENARKDYDRGVSALQKKKIDEAERHFLDLIQKYPDEKELVDRARVYLAVCERQQPGPPSGPDRARGLLLRGRAREEPGQRRRGDRAPEERRAEERRRARWTSCWPAATRSREIWRRRSSTCRRRSKKTSATGSWRGTTGTSTRCADARSSRSCWRPERSVRRSATRTPESWRSHLRGADRRTPEAALRRRGRRSRPGSGARAAPPPGGRRRVVILAAGIGSRMRSSLPKVLHRVAGRTLLEAVLDTAESARPSRVVVVLGAGRERVAPHSKAARSTFVVQDPPLGTGDAPARRSPPWDGNGRPGARAVRATRRCCAPRPSRPARRQRSGRLDLAFLSFRPPDPGDFGRVVRDRAGASAGSSRRRTRRPARNGSTEVNAGVYCFAPQGPRPRPQELARDAVSREYYLTDAVEILAVAGGKVEAVEAADWREAWGVNTRRDLAAAEEIEQRRGIERALDAGATVLDPATTRIGPHVRLEPDAVHPSLRLPRRETRRLAEGCEVLPFTRLVGYHGRPRCRRRAALRGGGAPDRRARARRALLPAPPGSVLGEDVRIGNFVETKKHDLGKGAKALHLSYLGDADVGAGANVGAGVITCNYDGEKKHRTTIGDGGLHRERLAAGGARHASARGPTWARAPTVTEDVPDGALAVSRAPREEHGRLGGTAKRGRNGTKRRLTLTPDGGPRQLRFSHVRHRRIRRAPGRPAPLLLEGLEAARIPRLRLGGHRDALQRRLHDPPSRREALQRSSRSWPGRRLAGATGIGHTRWATHGRPTETNAHPQTDCTGKIVVVHNGIFENFAERKAALAAAGHRFTSETDTEVFAHEVERGLRGRPLRGGPRATRKLRGAYAVLVSLQRASRACSWPRARDRPSCSALGEGENYVASDPVALVPWTRDVIFLEDGDVARVDADEVRDRQRGRTTASSGRSTASSGTPSRPRRAATATSWPRRSTSSRRRSPRRSAERSSLETGELYARLAAPLPGAGRRLRPGAAPRLRDLLALGPDRQVPDRGDGAHAGRSGLRQRVPLPAARSSDERDADRSASPSRARRPTPWPRSPRRAGRARRSPRSSTCPAARSRGWPTPCFPPTPGPRSASLRPRPSPRSSPSCSCWPRSCGSRGAWAAGCRQEERLALAHLPEGDRARRWPSSRRSRSSRASTSTRRTSSSSAAACTTRWRSKGP